MHVAATLYLKIKKMPGIELEHPGGNLADNRDNRVHTRREDNLPPSRIRNPIDLVRESDFFFLFLLFFDDARRAEVTFVRLQVDANHLRAALKDRRDAIRNCSDFYERIDLYGI